MLLRNFILALILFVSLFLSAQNPIGNATLEQRLSIIAQLHKAQKFDEALLELEDLQFYLKREKIQTTAEVIHLTTDVFLANNKADNLEAFLLENGLMFADGLSEQEKIELQKAIIHAYKAIGKEQIANDLEAELFQFYESLLVKKEQAQALLLKRQADSLRTTFTSSTQPDVQRLGSYFMKKKEGIILLLGLGVCALMLFVFYKKRKEKNDKGLDGFLEGKNLDTVHRNSAAQAIEILEREQNHTYYPSTEYTNEDGLRKIALIIHADVPSARYTRMVLSRKYQIEIAASIPEAKSLIDRNLPDIIFCAERIGQLDGVQYIRGLKMAELTMHIPILLIVKSTESAHTDMTRSKANGYILAPTPAEHFHEKINTIERNTKKRHADIQRMMQLWYDTEATFVMDSFLRKVFQCIVDYLGDPEFTPDVLSRKLQMSNLQCYRKLKAMTGQSPAALIRTMRLEKAKFMLEAGKMPKPLISQIVGYENEGTFTLAFKKHFGDTALLAS